VVQAFAFPSTRISPSTVRKTILLAQGQPSQIHLWKLALESQGHSVVLVSPREDLLEVAASQPLDLDLMVVDMTTGLFNPYAFCRECQSKLPNIPVILTHHPRRHIEPAERRWAIYQGAADVIPGLAEAGDLLHSLERIYEAARWFLPIDTEALHRALKQAGLWPAEVSRTSSSTPPPQPSAHSPTAPPQPITAEGDPGQKDLTPQVKYRLMYRGRPVD
jgi:CheY-like chemotaxis protein